jgi:hypothetical protein
VYSTFCDVVRTVPVNMTTRMAYIVTGASRRSVVKESKFVYNAHEAYYTGCPRRNVPDFGRAFLMLKYTDKTQNTYVQS